MKLLLMECLNILVVLQQVPFLDLRPLEVPKRPFDIIECTLVGKVILHLRYQILALVEVRIDDDVRFYGVGGEGGQCAGQSREKHDILYVAKSRRLKRSSGAFS